MTTTLVDDLRTARSRGVRPEAPDAYLCDLSLIHISEPTRPY